MPEMSWEIVQTTVTRIELGIVFVCKGSPKSVAPDDLAPLELAKQWNAVKDFAIDVPMHHGGNIAVVKKLHVVHHAKHCLVYYIGLVCRRHNQKRVRDSAPLGTAFYMELHPAPCRRQPKALVDRGFC